jgi:hypothetical protein
MDERRIAGIAKIEAFEGVSEAGAFSRNPEPKAKDPNPPLIDSDDIDP